jgi:acyl-CoA hydrolase
MRTVTLDELPPLLSALPANPRVVVSGNFATPHETLAALDAAVAVYRLHALNAQVGLPDREGVTLETCFVGPGMRRSAHLVYIPSRLSLVPRLFATTCPPDVVLVHCSLPVDGKVSLGIEVNILPAAIEAAKERGALVIAQANPQMPYTFGDSEIDLADIDVLVEVDSELTSPPTGTIDDVSAAIGERVASRVADGSTLQLGIGAVPDAVLSGLTGRRGLRVWSEMFSDGVLALDRAGALDQDTVLTSSFVFGSAELYRWVDRNPRVSMRRTETTNEPSLIARNHAMTSVNTALQVDLYAQANASRVHGRIYSGFGGQTDFIVGALHSDGGQAILALRSWHPRANVSTIVPMIDEPVTSFQASAIVTEQGTADIWGHDDHTQAAHLIEHAAHPDVRDELWEEAAALGFTSR